MDTVRGRSTLHRGLREATLSFSTRMLPIVGGLLPGISRVGRENQTVRRIARRLLHQDVPGGESIRELRKLCPELACALSRRIPASASRVRS